MTGRGSADGLLRSIKMSGLWHQPADRDQVVIVGQEDLGILQIRIGGTLRIATGAVVALKRAPGPFGPLYINEGAIDLAGGAFLVQANTTGGGAATLRNQIVAGRNGGAWNGTNVNGVIRSSLAAASPLGDGVGHGRGSEIAPAAIGPFAVGANDTLVRYALAGDANLDARVSLADFNRLAANFGQPNRQWLHGEANYDGTVNLADFNLLAGNFGGVAALGAPASNAEDDDDDEALT